MAHRTGARVSITPVTVNPDYVAKVRPEPNDPNNITIIQFKDGVEVGVEWKHVDVVKKLATHKLVLPRMASGVLEGR